MSMHSKMSKAGGSSLNVNSKESLTEKSIDKSSIEKKLNISGEHEGEGHHFGCGHERPENTGMKFLLPKLGTSISKANKKLRYGYLKQMQDNKGRPSKT